VLGTNPRVLILGSMPSVTSLERGEYYAHPRNAFWRLLDALGLVDGEAPYAERVEDLKQHDVALWDSLKACERSGSLDAAIIVESEVANGFATLFAQHPSIRLVAFNGAKAEDAFRRHVLPTLQTDILDRLTLVRLLSTSPAHAIPFEQKLAAWREILRFLDPQL
jgi:hypoxanthine-DNA glycosylase